MGSDPTATSAPRIRMEDVPQALADTPAAVLLVDLQDGTVIYANQRAQEMTPALGLPVRIESWGRAAGLGDPAGAELADTASPLSRIARGEPVSGEPVSVAAGAAGGEPGSRPLWVTGFPLAEVPALHDRALVMFFELPELGLDPDTADPLQDLRDRAVVATDISFTISDPLLDDNPLVWVNPAFSRTTGYGFAEAVGLNCRFLQGPGTDPAAVAEIRAAIAAQRPVTVTLLNYRRDGTAFWNQLSLSPVFDGGGRLTNIVGVQADVTARVQVEREREAAYERERQARAEAEDAQRRLLLLAEATTALSATLDVHTALTELARLALPILGDWSAVDVLDDEGQAERVAVAHVDPGREELVWRIEAIRPISSIAGSAAARTLATGRPHLMEVVDDAYLDAIAVDAEQRALLAELRPASLLVVPLSARRHLLGALTLVRTTQERRFDERDRVLASDLARRAALSVDNARLYTRERNVAEALQRSLLPRLPHVDGLATAARYRPSSRVADVGGDWYDVLPLPDGSVGLAIGDVMGHDLTAAAAMGQLRSVLRSYAWEGDRAALVLDRMDRLVQGLQMAQLATAVYGRLERAPDGSAHLRYANAGHLPPLLQEPDGTVRYLDEGHSVLLGVPAVEDRPEGHERLAPGATLLLYTDGLVERRGASLDDGLAWLRETVAAHRSADGPRALNDRLLNAVAGEALDDDVALLAVQVLAPDAPHDDPRSRR